MPDISYEDFLRAKMCIARQNGFPCDISEIHPSLFGHQKASVKWAVEGGQRAFFKEFGLGKTRDQLETIRLTILKSQSTKPGLIVMPLGVRLEFNREAKVLGIETKFIKSDAEIDPDFQGIYLTNYESIRGSKDHPGKITPSKFGAASLDESSILRSYGSLTYQSFIKLFADVPYKFVATATPSPNRYKELIHYSAFLGIMDSGQALTRFFQRSSTKANELTLYPHKEKEFFLWLSSWALFINKPSDIGFSDEGYDLPPLNVHWHELPDDNVITGPDRDGQTSLLPVGAKGLSKGAEIKRETINQRVAKMCDIIDNDEHDAHWLIWSHLEEERRIIKKARPGSTWVYGTQLMEEREQNLIDFAEGRVKELSTKLEIAGSGSNFQHFCHKAVYVGINYSFNDFVQGLHRIYRFGQDHPVDIHIIYTESEREIKTTLEQKWSEHKELTSKMSDLIKEHGLNCADAMALLTRAMGVERIEVSGPHYKVVNNDAILEARLMEDNSVDQIVTSIPFSNHYEYSSNFADLGHTDNNEHFWTQMDYLTPELLRILKPGRLACIHVKDRILFGNQYGTGVPTVSPFHVEAIMHYRNKHGFDYLGMITVVTDVVRENNQTYRLGWTENAKDSSKMGIGSPEYVLLLRKPQTDRSKAYADVPVTKEKPQALNDEGDILEWNPEDKSNTAYKKGRPVPGTGYSLARWQVDAHAFWRSSGDRLVSAKEMAGYGAKALAKIYTEYSLQHVYDYAYHIAIGEELAKDFYLPTEFMSLAPGSNSEYVWHDINRMRTLNGQQHAKGKELHICPLQTDIVDRLITRYSNPGDFIYDPFSGLATVALCAMKLGRRGGGSELNTNYFLDGLAYLKAEEENLRMPTLFNFEEFAATANEG